MPPSIKTVTNHLVQASLPKYLEQYHSTDIERLERECTKSASACLAETQKRSPPIPRTPSLRPRHDDSTISMPIPSSHAQRPSKHSTISMPIPSSHAQRPSKHSTIPRPVPSAYARRRSEQPRLPAADLRAVEEIVEADTFGLPLEPPTTDSDSEDNLVYENSFVSYPPPDESSLHDFLLNLRATSVASKSRSRPSTRSPRKIELSVKTEDQLTELVFCPNLSDQIHQIFDKLLENDPSTSDNLSLVQLDPDQVNSLQAGLELANEVKHYHNERDVEYIFRCSTCRIAINSINIAQPTKQRLFSRPGFAEAPNDFIPVPEHAYADIEITDGQTAKPIELKQPISIPYNFCALFLRQTGTCHLKLVEELTRSNAGYVFNFQWPSEESSLDLYNQPIIQIWTQLIEKQSHFAQASSHDHSIYAIKHPQFPRRLYLSSVQSLHIPPDIVPSPRNSKAYTMHRFWRAAFDDTLSQDVFNSLSSTKLMKSPVVDSTLPVYRHGSCIDFARVPPRTGIFDRVLRDRKPKNIS